MKRYIAVNNSGTPKGSFVTSFAHSTAEAAVIGLGQTNQENYRIIEIDTDILWPPVPETPSGVRVLPK